MSTTYTAAERAEAKAASEAKQADLVAGLKTKVAALREAPEFLAYLRFVSSFHTYSWNNAMLIMLQRPTATRVAGFHDWRKLGRFVRKGEKGIAIFAPLVRKVGDGDPGVDVVITDERTGKSNARSGREVFGFRLVYVFDVSQTDGEELPAHPYAEAAMSGAEADAALEARMRAVAASAGLTIADDHECGSAGGFYQPAAKLIALAAGNTDGQRLRALVHELAHHYAEHTVETRPEREAIADAAAYIVLAHYGQDMSEVAARYVGGWAEAGLLDKVLPVIVKTASKIMTAGDAITSAPPVAVAA